MSSPFSATEPAGRDPVMAREDHRVPAQAPWSGLVRRGETIRIVDLEGQQAVDTLFYRADDTASAIPRRTPSANGGRLFYDGHALMSIDGNVMLDRAPTPAVATTRRRRLSCESNTCVSATHTRYMHDCRDNFLLGVARHGLGKRDLAPNINFFMNVPVSRRASSTSSTACRAPGGYVELRAETDVLFVISNCPQLNNPCNGCNPTPIRLLVWRAEA